MRTAGMSGPAQSASLERSVEECFGCLPSASKERVNVILAGMEAPDRKSFMAYMRKQKAHIKGYFGILGALSEYPRDLLIELEEQFHAPNIFELASAVYDFDRQPLSRRKGENYG